MNSQFEESAENITSEKVNESVVCENKISLANINVKNTVNTFIKQPNYFIKTTISEEK